MCTHAVLFRLRQNDLYDEVGLSTRGKGSGLTLRLSGLITLLREAVAAMQDENKQLVS